MFGLSLLCPPATAMYVMREVKRASGVYTVDLGKKGRRNKILGRNGQNRVYRIHSCRNRRSGRERAEKRPSFGRACHY